MSADMQAAENGHVLPEIRPVDWQGGMVNLVRFHWCPGAAWLAGYPRSGAALVRTLMAHCFGHFTTSIYTESRLPNGYADTLKHLPESEATLGGVRKLAALQGLLTFKTHMRLNAPEETQSIVIVRDARRVFSSLRAFFLQRMATEYTARDVILGRTVWGDWSAWIRSWMQYGGDRALWLRYEDIMSDRKTAVDRIAAWFGIQPVSYEIPDFEDQHKVDPTIFRAAENEGNGGLSAEDEQLFWERHGTVMSMLGYHRE